MKRHGYARAYIDRDETKDDGPIRFVAATEGLKGDGIDLRMSGAQLDRYRANPIVGYGHMYWGRDSLPIGKSESTEVDGKRLLMDVAFDKGDDFAQTVDRKYRDGYMNAVSIGFDVLTWEDPKSDYWTGGVAEEWELFELSSVPLPMDADAVVESGRDALARALGELRAGAVLSKANKKLVKDAVTALEALLAAAGDDEDEEADDSDDDDGDDDERGRPRLAAARKRLVGI